MQYTEEEKQCYNALTKQGKWIVFGNDTKAIKRFVSKVMGKDYKFEISTMKCVFGNENVVKPLTK